MRTAYIVPDPDHGPERELRDLPARVGPAATTKANEERTLFPPAVNPQLAMDTLWISISIWQSGTKKRRASRTPSGGKTIGTTTTSPTTLLSSW